MRIFIEKLIGSIPINIDDEFLCVRFVDKNGKKLDINFCSDKDGISISGANRISVEPRAANMVYIKDIGS